MQILENIQNLVLSKKNGWLNTAILLLIILLILQYSRKTIKYEGFQQNEPFSIQRGTNSYDEFYAEIYDKLYQTESRTEKEAIEIIKSTQPDKEHSIFLDIGCGTGCLVNALKQRGFNAIGIDKSEAMIKIGKERRADLKNSLSCGDATNPLLYERGTFTHILCMERTIYEFKDKIEFFRNCKHWLLPGGYLFLHLVEPSKFNAIVPLGKPKGLSTDAESLKTTDGKRVTDTTIDFIDFKYKSNYDFSSIDKTETVIHLEQFVDSESNKVRQNEREMYMSSPKSILEDARYCGFLSEGEFISVDDKFQKIHILKSL